MRKHVKDYFVPHEGNDYQPSGLQQFAVSIIMILALLSFSAAGLQALLWTSSDWLISTILPAVITDLTNEERSDGALTPLHRNPVLDEAARLKAEDMARGEYFAHTSPDGVTPWYWFDKANYDFIHAGENLAVHFKDSDDVVEAWMDSPGHRANILNGNYTEIGVGTAKGMYKGYETVFVVQLFGTPALAAPEPSAAQLIVSNTTEIVTETEIEEATRENVAGEETSMLEEEQQPEEIVRTPTNEPATPVHEAEPPVASLYSDLATTSRSGTPAALDSIPPNEQGATSGSTILMRTTTQPHLWLQALYSLLAGIVVVSLTLSIVIEWRRQHPLQIAYGTGLLAAMALLYHVHTALTSGVTII